VLAFGRYRAGTLSRALIRAYAIALLGVLAIAIVLTPVAFARNVRYWHEVASGGLTSTYTTLPQYYLPTGLLPSWLLQTRWLFLLPPGLTSGTAGATLIAPLAILCGIGFAVRKRPVLLGLGAVLAITVLLAHVTWVDYNCSYCIDRNLLVDAPLLSAAFALGLGLLFASKRRTHKAAAVAAGLIGLIGIYNQLHTGHQWIKQAAFSFDHQTRTVLARVPKLPEGMLALEGFSQTYPSAPIENPTVYAAARSAAGSAPSTDPEAGDYSGFAYMTGQRPLTNQLNPAYRYVLTRVGSVQTARRTIFQNGPIALQQRVDPLDVLLISGYGATFVRADPAGSAWIQRALLLFASGGIPGEPIHVTVQTQVTSSASVAATPGVLVSRSGAMLDVCADAPSGGGIP
jgi:hypothetical protein